MTKLCPPQKSNRPERYCHCVPKDVQKVVHLSLARKLCRLYTHARTVEGKNNRIKMASSMSGMFSGQQPPGAHPVGGPGGPGQPSFASAAPRTQGSNTLVDELEASFEVGVFSAGFL